VIEGKARMRTVPFDLFPAKEQEDFRISCRHWGRSLDEFLVRAEEDDSPPGHPGPLRRQVIVTHLSLRRTRRYDAALGSGWIRAFEDDVQALFYSHSWI
jgi:hypothetical protein